MPFDTLVPDAKTNPLVGVLKPKTHASILAVVNLMESDMERMSEFFKLPVTRKHLKIPVSSVLDDVDVRDAEYCTAHAINHVDLLADALDALLIAVTTTKKDDSINNAIINAARAINAYRGEA